MTVKMFTEKKIKLGRHF